MMSVMELGCDQDTCRLVSDADDTLGLPGAQGGSYGGPAFVSYVDGHGDSCRLVVGVSGHHIDRPLPALAGSRSPGVWRLSSAGRCRQW